MVKHGDTIGHVIEGNSKFGLTLANLVQQPGIVDYAQQGYAQQPGAVASIRGRTIDPQRRGVQATIRVVQLGNGLTRESQADADGYFAITSLPPGTIDLIVTAAGFAERRISGVRLEVGQAAEVEVPLQLSAP